jgi:hypothetical protein
LSDKIVDLLFIAETKLDQSFNDNLFQIDGYKLFRRDRNCHGGGIMALVNTDFPSRRKGNLESENMENISIEVYINDKKLLIMGIYKAPSMSDNDFSTYFIKNIDECIRYYENIILLGDLNFDMVNNQTCQNDICDVFNLSQLITNATCFKKGCTPSPVDVILTNQKKICVSTFRILLKVLVTAIILSQLI